MTTKDILLGNVSREADAPREIPQSPIPAVTVPAKAETTESGTPQMTYEDMYRKLYPAPPSAEEDEKERKRHRRNQIFNALGDGIMALSNLFFTTKGAPNMYTGKETMSGRAQVRYDRLMKERDASRRAYMSGLIQSRQADNADRRLRLAQDKDKREQEQHGWLAALQPDKVREQKNKADKAAREALTAKAEADNAPDLYEARVETERARKDSYTASANRHNRAESREFRAWDKNGKVHYFKSKDAADRFAQQNGTYYEKIQEETTETKDDHGRTKTVTKKSKTGYPVNGEDIDDGQYEEEDYSQYEIK